jgi:transcriptional regulator with XRE-family HTH domain
MKGKAGERLRQLRNKLGLTAREVADLSRRIATAESNEEFSLSHARLIQIENDESTPNIYKLFTLAAIYARPFTEMVSYYIDLDAIPRHHATLQLDRTRTASFDDGDDDRPITFPIRFDPGFKIEKTSLLSRLVEVWGEVPASVLRQLNVRKVQYGFIGLGDYTMYPLLRPGSFVQVEEQPKLPGPGPFRSEYERPIWFLELRDSYICSWCEVRRDRIVSVPHPLSPARTQEFAFPQEAEIVGRVTAVAARLVNCPEPGQQPAGPPAQS